MVFNGLELIKYLIKLLIEFRMVQAAISIYKLLFTIEARLPNYDIRGMLIPKM
jgi:hypothetical protein